MNAVACLRRSFFSLILLLAGIRIFQVLLNFSGEFGGLFRPQPVTSEYTGLVVFFVAAILLWLTGQSMRRIDTRQQNRLLCFLAAEYSFLALLHNKVGKRSFICELIDSNLAPDELLNLLSLDFFFQEPFYFWGLLWLTISWKLAARADKRHLLPIFWLPLLAFASLSTNAFQAIAAMGIALSAAVCYRFCRSSSAYSMIFFMILTQALLLFATKNSSAIYRTSWIATIIVLLATWVPGLLFAATQKSTDKLSDNAVLWLIPGWCSLAALTALTNVPLALNLFNLWFSTASIHFATTATAPAIYLSAIVLIANRYNQRLGNIVFYLLGFVAACFYLLDATMMYKTGLRLSFYTIDWIIGLKSLTSLAKTVVSMKDSWPLLLVFACLPLILRKTREIAHSPKIIGTIAPFLIMALSASLAYQTFDVNPVGVFKDPFNVFISSTPVFSDKTSSYMPFAMLQKGFAECGIENVKVPEIEASNTAKPAAAQQNLILVMLESTANTYLSLFGHDEPTWPRLERYRERMEIFPFFFSNFPESSNADFAVMSGLFPANYLVLHKHSEIRHKLLVDHLKEAGYDCSMFFSGFTGDSGLSSFYRPRGFDRVYDAGNMPGASREDGWIWGIKEHFTISRIKDLLDQHARQPEKPFFIYYRMLFPHAPFQSVGDKEPTFDEDGYQHGNLVGRFKNSLLYQDEVLAEMLKHLDASIFGKSTVVLLVSDHGTMLGENGKLGHGWSLAPELTNVPMLIIRPEPAGEKINLRMGCHVDILPTALSAVGHSQPSGILCQGLNLLDESPAALEKSARRKFFLSSMTQSAIVENSSYLWFADDKTSETAAFKIARENGKTIFAPEHKFTAAELLSLRQMSKKFTKLQTIFLANLRLYQK